MEAFALEKAAAPHPLRIAVPKGSLNEDAIAALDAAGLNVDGLADAGRTLMLRNGDVEYIIVRPTDAPVFVALGAADCGICGEDSLVEARTDVVELVDLEFGGCRFVVAESAGTSEAVEETLPRTRLDTHRHEIPAHRPLTLRQAGQAGRDREAARQYRARSHHRHGRADCRYHCHRNHPARKQPGRC